MAKTRGVDAKLNRLRLLRQEGASPQRAAELRSLLADSSNLIVAEAAQLAGAHSLAELVPDLAAAFDRFMLDPEDTDKGCRATTALVEALNQLDYHKEDIFLRGIKHFQPEGVWGGSQDAAAPLRGASALALMRIGHRDRLLLVADLLADSEKVARLAAVEALGASGLVAAIPLLRFKARSGDKEPAVTAECLTALVRLTPAESLPFVAEFLRRPEEELQEGAAFALAESRRPEALTILKAFWPSVPRGPMQEVVLLAIALLRLPASLDLLFEILEAKDRSAAAASISALAIHKHNDAIKTRVKTIVAARGDDSLKARFRSKMESTSE